MDPAGARGVAAATQPRSPRGRRGPGRSRAFLPSPSSFVAQRPSHLAAGRGAPRAGRRGSPGRLSRMLRCREPCSCHGRSSFWPALPRHFRFLFLRTSEAGAARLFPQIRDPSPGRSPSPDLASHLS
uniref:Uncharacterized protein n=1 Tax=Rangifer tarandus platyrhynchus TaxID=3082113 RepID=A0ACB0F856_RANTA|nr:unnamed protein product [Rangifer tarandus platyrhynchus]